MKPFRVVSILLVAMFITGCANNKVASRKQERAAAYAALTPAQQRLIDEGRIEVGMPADAVYIAWGKPALIVPTTPGATTWIYKCQDIKTTPARDYRYTQTAVSTGRATYREVPRGTQFEGSSYDCAEVNFEADVVKGWRELPKPGM